MAVATLTYVYADSTAVVGPLAAFAEPHSYDLCEQHARGLTAPRGWDLVRHEGEFGPPPPSTDDLVALAEAVREAARPAPRRDEFPEDDRPGAGSGQRSAAQGQRAAGSAQPGQRSPSGGQVGRRGHLRVIPPAQSG